MTVRRIVFDPDSRTLHIGEYPDPALPAGGILAQVTHAGVCGTDAHRLAGDLPPTSGPIALGHEAVGTVLEMADGRTTDTAGRPLAIGDRVAWYAPSGCGLCRSCVADRDPATCVNLSWPYPDDQDGAAGFQEVAALSRSVAVYRVPDSLSSEAVGAFGCAMPTALSALDQVGPLALGSIAVVLGSGPVGLAATLALARTGLARLIVVGTGAERLAAAKALGATDVLDIATTSTEERRRAVLDASAGRGADLVFEAAGVPAAFTDGLALLATRGTLAVVGLYSGRAEAVVDPVDINNRKLRIVGALGSDPGHLLRGIELLERTGSDLDLDLESLLTTETFALDDTESAIRSLSSGRVVKTYVSPAATPATTSL